MVIQAVPELTGYELKECVVVEDTGAFADVTVAKVTRSLGRQRVH